MPATAAAEARVYCYGNIVKIYHTRRSWKHEQQNQQQQTQIARSGPESTSTKGENYSELQQDDTKQSYRIFMTIWRQLSLPFSRWQAISYLPTTPLTA